MGACLSKAKDGCLLVATRDTIARHPDELSLRQGDLLFSIDRKCKKGRFFVLHLTSMMVGIVPSDAVKSQTIADTSAWDRRSSKLETGEAERLVTQHPNLPVGTFLLRNRNSKSDGYALSLTVRSGDERVDHYPIKNQEGQFYTEDGRQFTSIRDLVAHHSVKRYGLKTRLTCPAPNADWRIREVDRNELVIISKIDDGNFADVFKAKWRGVNEVAVKSIHHGSMETQALLAEARIMQKCDHPNLCRVLGVCTEIEPFYIVLEFMQNGSLLTYLQRMSDSDISFKCLIDICAQVAAGMEYMEQHKMVHRDLAARNVLVGEVVGEFHVIKVADFGLAKALINSKEYYRRCTSTFPYKWTAPEAIQTHKFTIKSDVWSFGVLLYEIMTAGSDPYTGTTSDVLITKLLNGYRLPRPNGCDQRVYNCMFSCWNAAPNQRPIFRVLREFFEHFFTDKNLHVNLFQDIVGPQQNINELDFSDHDYVNTVNLETSDAMQVAVEYD